MEADLTGTASYDSSLAASRYHGASQHSLPDAGEKLIMLENWVLSLSNYKQAALKISNCLLARTQVEQIKEGGGYQGGKSCLERRTGRKHA